MQLSTATSAAMGNMCGWSDSNGLPRGVAHSGRNRPSFWPCSVPTDLWRLSVSRKGCICQPQLVQQWVTCVVGAIRMACAVASRTADGGGPASDHVAYQPTFGDCQSRGRDAFVNRN